MLTRPARRPPQNAKCYLASSVGAPVKLLAGGAVSGLVSSLTGVSQVCEGANLLQIKIKTNANVSVGEWLH